MFSLCVILGCSRLLVYLNYRKNIYVELLCRLQVYLIATLWSC
uniref:Uncharacterized protein n=1 Tax=Anguilla anguilla TaxID=7936 RepID=A0A0E9VWL1_ANGAN